MSEPERNHPRVSVLIPAYNREPYILAAIDSVLSQDYAPLELIVIDDGSTDGTYPLLQEQSRLGRIRLLSHPGHANRGQSASLNLGLRAATGDYLAILDSDDLFAPGKLTEQVGFLEKNPGVGMVYGYGHAVDAAGHFLYALPGAHHEEPGDPCRLLLDCYMALPGGSLIRRSVLQQVGEFEEGFRAAQDHDMALRIMEKTRVAYLPSLAFYYRKHGDSISTRGLERRWQTGMEILRRAAQRYPYPAFILRKRKAVLHFRLAQTYWTQALHWRALRNLVLSGLLDPQRALRVLMRREAI
ncbi:MAG: glycosyltransferase [Oleiphilaceae bacterium]|nr:glycosyltransferase [Oleiphilaceae bacterium]